MNVFEDLIVELKQENLLESTELEAPDPVPGDTSYLDTTEVPNRPVQDDAADEFDPDRSTPASEYDLELRRDAVQREEPAAPSEPAAPTDETKPLQTKKGKEFFKKRAVNEVSSLQMVEHVLTGVEREFLKTIPKTYDDFGPKKALNAFLQCDEDADSQAHTEAEFALMQETEAWCSALAKRDKQVPVSSLRQYCENSKPPLSSQAMLSIARFYRNLPYSEDVRAKFDFVITRLFSKPIGQEKRAALFSRAETLTHITTLYNDWSSIPLYTAEDDDSKISLTALSFDDMAIEAENAVSFDHLIESDFFGRLRLFKESISELFFAPDVTAAAIESNIRIGNAYVTLISRERRKLDVKSLQLKYEAFDHGAVSDTTGRTIQLEDILRELEDVSEEPPQAVAVVDAVAPEKQAPPRVAREVSNDDRNTNLASRLAGSARSVNKWFLAVALALIAGSIGLWVWANYFVTQDQPTSAVQTVDFNGAAFQDHIKAAKLSGENLYVQLQPSWDLLPKEKRQEYLQAIYKTSGEKGFTQVNLINKDGKYVGFASANRLDVVMP
ncbi:MAG: hypothetical protein JO053_01085 [Acidobacteria bacterium]|nr:hypothetical protein [Acidobacteriota bacterium]